MNLAIKISLQLSAASTACKAGRPRAACILAAPVSLPGFPHLPGPNPNTCWPDPTSLSWESLPPGGSRSQKTQLVVELFRTIPTGCRRLWEAMGGEGEGEREGGQGHFPERFSPGSAQLVFVQPRSWYSVPPQRPINGNRMILWI